VFTFTYDSKLIVSTVGAAYVLLATYIVFELLITGYPSIVMYIAVFMGMIVVVEKFIGFCKYGDGVGVGDGVYGVGVGDGVYGVGVGDGVYGVGVGDGVYDGVLVPNVSLDGRAVYPGVPPGGDGVYPVVSPNGVYPDVSPDGDGVYPVVSPNGVYPDVSPDGDGVYPGVGVYTVATLLLECMKYTTSTTIILIIQHATENMTVLFII